MIQWCYRRDGQVCSGVKPKGHIIDKIPGYDTVGEVVEVTFDFMEERWQQLAMCFWQ